MVRVEEVYPDRSVPDACLPLARLADFDVFPAEDIGAARLVYANGFRHGSSLVAGRVRVRICRSPLATTAGK